MRWRRLGCHCLRGRYRCRGRVRSIFLGGIGTKKEKEVWVRESLGNLSWDGVCVCVAMDGCARWMHMLKREVALGERAAGFDASKVDLHDKEHEREVNCGCVLMLLQTGVNVWRRASRVLSQTGMKPLQASTALGESSSANAYSNCVTREMSQCGRTWQDSCNDRCIMMRGR